jgi:hypothetical protein
LKEYKEKMGLTKAVPLRLISLDLSGNNFSGDVENFSVFLYFIFYFAWDTLEELSLYNSGLDKNADLIFGESLKYCFLTVENRI